MSFSTLKLDFNNILNDGFTEIRQIQEKSKILLNLFGQYQGVKCLSEHKLILQNYMQKIQKSSDVILVCDLSFPEELKDFISIAFKTSKFLHSSFFSQFVKLEKLTTKEEFLKILETALDNMLPKFNDIIVQLNKGTLKMEVIKTYFYSMKIEKFDKDLEEIAKVSNIKAENLEILKNALIFHLKQEELLEISLSLEKIIRLFSFKNIDLCTACQNYHELHEKSIDKQESMLVKDFLNVSQELLEKLEASQIKDTGKSTEINKIMCEMSLGKDLFEFLNKIQMNEFTELKDYINDLEESFLSVKTIKAFEKVFRYKNDIIQKSKTIEDLFKNTLNIIKEKEFSDLNSCIKEGVTLKNTVERTLNDMKNRDASIKFRISEIMECSTITFLFDEKHFIRNVLVETNPIDKETKKSTYDAKNLNEKKEKMILKTNSKQSQDEDNIIDSKLLENFVSFCDIMNLILFYYQELDEYGYFENFIEGPNKFVIKQGIFQELENYHEKVKSESKNWKKNIEKAYMQSYNICFYHGKQLKLLKSYLLGELKLDECFENMVNYSKLDLHILKQKIEKDKINLVDPLKNLEYFKLLLNESDDHFFKLQEVNQDQMPLVK